MTINQAWKAVQTEGATLTNSIYNGMFDIDFINGEGCTDEVQFTVRRKNIGRSLQGTA